MRMLAKNKQKMFYSMPTGKELPIYELDESGNIKYMEMDGVQVPVETGNYEPEYSVLYLILCILGLEWIPMFLCRNNVPVGIAGHCHPRQPRYNVD